MKYEKSCGALIFRKDTDGWNVLLIRHARGKHISFPKGHMEAGESEIETAIRELKEETGVEVSVIQGFRHQIEYPMPCIPNAIKQSVYFLGECNVDNISCQETEVAEAGFVSYENALEMLTFDETKAILKAAESLLVSK